MDELISTNKAASILNISVQAVRGLLRRGRLDGQKIGRDWVINRYSVLAYKLDKEKKKKKF